MTRKGWYFTTLRLTPLAIALASGDALSQARQALVVYTAADADRTRIYKEQFEKAHPSIEIQWVRDTSGEISRKLLAERGRANADVVFGVTATIMSLLAQEGVLQPYEPKGFKELNPDLSDPVRPPSWIGMSVMGATICFNTLEAKRLNIPKPESWRDLSKPVYKDRIVMPDPASSATGYLAVAGWVHLWGDEAWKYMDALHKNMQRYTLTGFAPCRQAATGEALLGISFENSAHQLHRSGAPLDMLYMREGIGWDIEAAGIVKGTRNADAAKVFVDWAASKEANQINANWWPLVAYPGIGGKLDGIPADYENKLIKNNDFKWAARNREKILAEWTKRYADKIDPR